MDETSRSDIESSDGSDIDISIIIISWNTKDILRECLDSLAGGSGSLAHEVIVIDNGSSDGSQEMVLGDFPEVKLIENEANLGFPRAVNQGIASSKGRYVAILNSDTILSPASLQHLVEYLEENPRVGAVGPQLVSKDGHFQYSGGHAPNLYSAFNELLGVNLVLGRRSRKLFVRSRSPRNPVKLDWLCAACMVVRRESVEDVGMFDDSHFMYAEDMEYGMRLRSHDWGVDLLPEVKVVHYGGASSSKFPEPRLLWLGGLFRVASGELSRTTYAFFGMILSLAYLERSVLLRTAQAMPRMQNSGLANAREAITYAKTAFKLGFHDPQYADSFCRKLEDSFRHSR